MSISRSDKASNSAMDSSTSYLNKALGIVGGFLFIYGIHEAFFSMNTATTVSYFLVVLSAPVFTISYVQLSRTSSLTGQLQSIREHLLDREQASRRTSRRSFRNRGQDRARKRKNNSDIQRYYQSLRKQIDKFTSNGRSSRRNGRDRL